MTADVILGIVYGVDMQSATGKKYLHLVNSGMRILSIVGETGAYLGIIFNAYNAARVIKLLFAS